MVRSEGGEERRVTVKLALKGHNALALICRASIVATPGMLAGIERKNL